MKYCKGVYHMEGVMGYEQLQVLKPIEFSRLQVKDPGSKWKTLMVDDPMHWLGMQELASLAMPGSVLVAGLGLGLILHHLVKRDDIDKIVVIEIDPEVISFISPYIPKDSRINIINANFFTFCFDNKVHYNTAIIDLWVLSDKSSKAERERVEQNMIISSGLSKDFSDKVLIWGIRTYEVRKRR